MPFLRFGVLVGVSVPLLFVDRSRLLSDRPGYRTFDFKSMEEVMPGSAGIVALEEALATHFGALVAQADSPRARMEILREFAALSHYPWQCDWFRAAAEHYRSGPDTDKKSLQKVLRAYVGLGGRKLSTILGTLPDYNRLYLLWLRLGKGKRDPHNIKLKFEKAEGRPLKLKDTSIRRVMTEYRKVFTDEFLTELLDTLISAAGQSGTGYTRERLKDGLVQTVLEVVEKAYDVTLRVPPDTTRRGLIAVERR